MAEAESQTDREYRHTHGSSFGTTAAAYAEYRPGYAEAAVRWALEPAGTREPPRVDYALTPMGLTLLDAIGQLVSWADSHLPEISAAQAAYDTRHLAE